MQEDVAAALERQDYRTVAKLLQQWQQESPQDPWFKLYVGRLQEATGKLQAAEVTYRGILKSIPNAKIMAQARQGLQRIEAVEAARRQQALDQANASPDSQQAGVLVLEPVQGESRTVAAKGLAQAMQLDPYTAQMQLPSRGWRLYRTGPMGSLMFYEQELQRLQVPAFCQKLADVQAIPVFRVQHIEYLTPQVTVVCQSPQDQLGSLSFGWNEVNQRVEGLLPIFEKVVDLNARKRLERKEKTQDYAHLYDLHLPERKCILRFCDRNYQFQRSIEFPPSPQEPAQLAQVTKRINWNRLLHYLNQNLSVPLWSDFQVFGDSALDLIDLFSAGFATHIDLFRQTQSNWDSAFQLYSGLLFVRSQQTPISTRK